MDVDRILAHGIVFPAVGFVAVAFGLDVWGAILLDIGLSAGYEAWRVKAIAALAVGGKNILVPVAGFVLLPISIPTPSTVAVVFAAILGASTVAGLIVYRVRRRARPANHAGRHWKRPLYASLLAAAAVGVEAFAAGAALTVPPIGVMHVGIALLAAPLWLASYGLQNPPHRGGSQVRRSFAVLRRAWDYLRDVPGQDRLAAGAR